MTKEDLATIKETVEEFFQKTTFEIEVEVSLLGEGDVSIELKTPEPQILIGEGGQTLAEIQHLLKAVLRRKIQEQFYINLDVNDYKKKKFEYLRELARSTADEVSLVRIERRLPPMPASERRVVHLELAGREDVASESVGEEPARMIVIKPRP